MIDYAQSNNPLLDSLPLPVNFDALPALLLNEPLNAEVLRSLPAQDRASLLAKISSHFVPTSTAIDIADAILTAIFAGYEERNPCLAQIKKQRYLVGGWQGKFDGGWPGFITRNARCVTIDGITGLGKSAIVDRTLSLLPQVVKHGPSEAAGWTMQKQLVWVKVDMTSDGSRLGFLMQLYRQIDAALGTDYFSQYSAKKWSVEHHMVSVSKILYNCFCGALIIEEIQERNFAQAASRDLMVLFFLRLANLGIPIVLIGNPKGFEGFNDFTQDVRRFTSGGLFNLWPALFPHDPDWAEFLVPGMLQFNVMRNPPLIRDSARLLFRCTGGVCDYLAKLLAQAQLLALRRGQEFITDADVLEAYEGPTIKASHPLIRALADRDVNALSQFRDIPVMSFVARWAESDELIGSSAINKTRVSPPSGATPSEPEKKRRPRFQTAESMYKRKVTSGIRRQLNGAEKRKRLSQDDLRAEGLKNVLLDNFEKMRLARGRKS
ncbi:AAA family ATPase [Trinickia sp. YCB016]